MAVTASQVIFSQTLQAWDVTSDNAADTTISIAPADGYAMFEPNMVDAILPLFVVIQPTLAVGVVSAWFWDQANTTTTALVLTKTAGAGSISGSPQARVYALAPHSII